MAGTITLVPSFSTLANLDLTPPSPEPLSLSISRLAPRLLSLDISNRTQTGLQLVLSGFSTTRSWRQVDIELVPRNGEKFSATKLTLNTESAALAWFEGSQGQGSGGLFVLTIPINLQREQNEDLVRFIQSVNVVAQNEVGPSNSMAVTIP